MPSRDIYDLPPVPVDTTRYANQTPMEFFGVDRLVPRLGAYDPEADLMASYGRPKTPREAASQPVSPTSTERFLFRPTRPGWGLAARHQGVPVVAPQSIPTSEPALLPMSAMPDPSNPYQMRSPLDPGWQAYGLSQDPTASTPLYGRPGPATFPMRDAATLAATAATLPAGPMGAMLAAPASVMVGHSSGAMGEEALEQAYGEGTTKYADPHETYRTELRQAALGDMENITPEQTQEIGAMLAGKILEAQASPDTRRDMGGSMTMEASPSRELMNRMANKGDIELLERSNLPLEFSKRMEPPRDLTSPSRMRMNPAMTPKVADMVRSLGNRAQPEIYRPLHPQGPYPQGHFKQDMLPQGPFQAINPYEGR